MSTISYPRFSYANYDPVDAIISHLSEVIPEIRFGADFSMGYMQYEDGEWYMATHMRNNDYPACAIYESTHRAMPIGLGGYVDSHGIKRAQMIDATLTFDVWARDSKERERASGIISGYIFDKLLDKIRALGFLQFQDQSTRSRGFDLTDRILQFHSHQLTNVWRRLIDFDVVFERIYKEEPVEGIIEQIHVNMYDSSDQNLGTLIIGQEVIPYLILKRLKMKW